MLLLVPGHLLRLEPEPVADVGAAVEARVGVEHLAPLARRPAARPASPRARPARGSRRTTSGRFAVARTARANASTFSFAAFGSSQRKPSCEWSSSQSAGWLAVDAVQVADERLHAGVVGVVEQVPVERAGRLAPLLLLAELAAHEEQLLAGMRPHVAVERAQVGEALPAVAGHPPEQRALAVHDLVVRERQDEVLVPGVDQREGQLVVVEAAVDRLLREVLERVVHPAHVPLEAEAEPAEIGRPRDAGPRRRLLRDREHARLALVQRPRSAPAGTRPPRGPRGRRTRSAPTRPPCASSRGRASTRRRPRAARRRGTRAPSRARSRAGSCAPRCGRG